LARNFACRVGEIDLICEAPASAQGTGTEAPQLVFVEVRLRNHLAYGSGADTVDLRKQQRLTRAARYYLLKHQPSPLPVCRFDVLSLRRSNAREKPRWQVQWIRDAFP
jgi:putative endonuclease